MVEHGPAVLTGGIPADELIGGRFRIQALLGRGGMGAVYRVIDEQSGRSLALKRVRARDEAQQADYRARFEREFHTLAELAHPRIVSVYDYGVDEVGAYYTMELLTGDDLQALGKQPWKRVCALLRDVASALAILHSRRLLHCDLSARNVRCTAEGRAKLIDFGAMAPIGAPIRIVGTPPFIAAEVVHHQALDARADLFSLGALAYWLLTGVHAFPARTLRDLPDLWRSTPTPPSQRCPDIPEPLSALVTQLLRVDRMARPSSASEVMERLSALANLPMDERPEVTQAYLTMPRLVGRDEELAEARGVLESAGKGPAALVIEGIPGSGRTRMLAASVLSAKLVGATVVRADESDGARGSYGALRSLAGQMIQYFPDLSRELARPWLGLIGRVVPELSDGGTGPEPDRGSLQGALRDWFAAVARIRRLVFAIDDFDRIDEPSAAVLAALAAQAKWRGCRLVITTTEGAETDALPVLRGVARTLRLPLLDAKQIEELMRSLFGEAANVALVARYIYQQCEGNPGRAMELAQHLVDRRLARYEAGAWFLPRELQPDDLPSVVSLDRFATLSKTAQQLAEALSLTDPAVLSIEHHAQLLGDLDPARVYRALDELVAVGLLLPAGERWPARMRDWQQLLRERIEPERRRQLHARLAEVYESLAAPVYTAHHLLQAGQVLPAIEFVHARLSLPAFGPSPQSLRLLRQLVAASRDLPLAPLCRSELTTALVSVSAIMGARDPFVEYAPDLLMQLERESGVEDFDALAGKVCCEDERLQRAIECVERRYEQSAPEDRGLHWRDALRLLGRVCSAFASMARVAMDARLVLALPPIAPFGKLSPSVALIGETLETTKLFMTARVAGARAAASALIDRLSSSIAGVDPTIVRTLRLGLLHMLGAIDAVEGRASAVEHAAALEHTPGYRGAAWRVRRVASIMMGDFDTAAECQRRAELLELQDGQHKSFGGNIIRIEACAQWMVGDLVGLKQSIEHLTGLAAVFPAWSNTLAIARCHLRRLQGDAAGAVEEIEAILPATGPGRDLDFPWAASAHISALVAAGRAEEAADNALRYEMHCNSDGQVLSARSLIPPTIEALAKSGRLEEALTRVDRAVEELVEDNVRGLWLGACYESRAHVAIAMGDDEAFERNAELCATEYRRSKNSTLVRSYERLMEEAKRNSIGVPSALQEAVLWSSSSGESGRLRSRVGADIAQRFDACRSAEERLVLVLSILVDASPAQTAFLYATRGGRAGCVASWPAGRERPGGLDAAVDTYLRKLLSQESATVTLEEHGELANAVVEEVTLRSRDGSDASSYRPVLLMTRHDGDWVLAAIALLDRVDHHSSFGQDLLDTIATQLIKYDDIAPWAV